MRLPSSRLAAQATLCSRNPTGEEHPTRPVLAGQTLYRIQDNQRDLLVDSILDIDGNRGPAASRDSLCCFLDASSGSELSSNGHPSIGCRPSAHLARRTPYAHVVPQWMSDGCGCDPETSPRWHLHRMTDVRDLPISVILLAADIDEEVSSQLFVP